MKQLIFNKIFLLILISGFNFNLFGQWTQLGNTINSADSDFGYDIELSGDGNTFIVGSPYSQSNGTATIFKKTVTDSWEQLGNIIQGNNSSDRLGYSVAINNDGNVVAVSLPGVDNPTIEVGKVQVYTLNNGNWIQRGNDINTSGGFEFGWEIDLDDSGDNIAITSIGSTGGDIVYTWNGTDWTQKGQLFVETGDFSPFSTSLSGDGMHVAFGSPNLFGLVDEPGSVYIYSWNGTNWEQKGSSINADVSYNDFGTSVSISDSGERVAIGIPKYRDDNNQTRGAVKIFSFESGDWQQLGGELLGEDAYDEFGGSVKMSGDGNTVVTSAVKNDNGGGLNSGHVRAFFWNGVDWEQKGIDIDGNDFNAEFGFSLGLSTDGNNIISSSNGTKEVKYFYWDQVSYISYIDNQHFSYGPNPTNDFVEFNMESNLMVRSMSICDIFGKKYALKKIMNSNTFQIQLPENKGIYFIEIGFDNKHKSVIPIVKH